MEATERFADVVARDDSRIALDEACFLIAAHVHPTIDIAARRAQLDALAASLDADHPATLARALFSECGFAGNTVDYGDPSNSYLDDVLDRRLGIPISLSVLMLEVGRRRGIAVYGVGMPGHFLVGATDGWWYDPFYGGARLDYEGCASRFAQVQHETPFRADYLAPVGARAILDRMLANLQNSLVARSPADAAWPTRLRLRIPGLTARQRGELAALLGSLGRFSEAAAALDALARELPGDAADEAARAAARFRARAN
ncbi:MAG TPA: transglutaminase-like domain-containing protein [Acidimicrobiia bacterium]|nr:transglutaminase-like domain-containing protein [Acidimicrobiia bacterium]